MILSFITFTAQKLLIYDQTPIYLRSHRNPKNGLWNIDLANQQSEPLTPDLRHIILQPSPVIPSPFPAAANHVYSLDKQRDIVSYLYKACFIPVPSTWIPPSAPDFSAHGPAWPENSSARIYQKAWPLPRSICAPLTSTNAQPKPPHPHNLNSLLQKLWLSSEPSRSNTINASFGPSKSVARYLSIKRDFSPIITAVTQNTSWYCTTVTPMQFSLCH